MSEQKIRAALVTELVAANLGVDIVYENQVYTPLANQPYVVENTFFSDEIPLTRKNSGVRIVNYELAINVPIGNPINDVYALVDLLRAKFFRGGKLAYQGVNVEVHNTRLISEGESNGFQEYVFVVECQVYI